MNLLNARIDVLDVVIVIVSMCLIQIVGVAVTAKVLTYGADQWPNTTTSATTTTMLRNGMAAISFNEYFGDETNWTRRTAFAQNQQRHTRQRTDRHADGRTDISNIPRGVGGQRTRLEQHHKNKYQQQQQQMHCNKLVANAKKKQRSKLKIFHCCWCCCRWWFLRWIICQGSGAIKGC